MPPTSPCSNVFDGTCLGRQMRTDARIVIIFTYVAFLGVSSLTYSSERRYTKMVVRERVTLTPWVWCYNAHVIRCQIAYELFFLIWAAGVCMTPETLNMYVTHNCPKKIVLNVHVFLTKGLRIMYIFQKGFIKVCCFMQFFNQKVKSIQYWRVGTGRI